MNRNNKTILIVLINTFIILTGYYIFIYINSHDYLICLEKCSVEVYSFDIINNSITRTKIFEQNYTHQCNNITYDNYVDDIIDKSLSISCHTTYNSIIKLYLWTLPLSILFLILLLIYINHKKFFKTHSHNISIFIILLILKYIFYIISLLNQTILIHEHNRFQIIIEGLYLLFIYLCFTWFIISSIIIYKKLKNEDEHCNQGTLLEKYYIFSLICILHLVGFIMWINNDFKFDIFDYTNKYNNTDYEIDYEKYVNNNSYNIKKKNIIHKYIISFVCIVIIHYIYIIMYFKIKQKKNNDNYKHIKTYFNIYALLCALVVYSRCIEIISWEIQNDITYYLSLIDIFQGIVVYFIILYFQKKITNLNSMTYLSSSIDCDVCINSIGTCFNCFIYFFDICKIDCNNCNKINN